MSEPIKSKRNIWVLPALILWGFAPALFIATSILGGWSSGEAGFIGPGQSDTNSSDWGEIQRTLGVFLMPVILYAWSVVALRWFDATRTKTVGLAIPLTIAMCAANILLGITGCNALTDIVPKEGIF